MRRIAHGTLAAALALLTPTVAWADYPFILPSATNLAGNNNVVTFDAAGADHPFFFDHRPVQLGTIKVTAPDGSVGAVTNSVQGRFRSVFDVRLDRSGTWRVTSEQAMIGGTFKLNGEERRVGGRGGPPPGVGGPGGGPGAPPRDGDRPGGEGPRGPGGPGGGEGGPRRAPPVAVDDIPADATDVHLTETVRTTATFVTAGAPTTGAFRPTGKGLEFDPVTHPNDLAAGETARFRFLLDGKPAPGLKVTVVPGGDRYREAAGVETLATGADGVVAIKWPAAGMYWLGAEMEDRHPTDRRAQARHLATAVTLEVATP